MMSGRISIVLAVWTVSQVLADVQVMDKVGHSVIGGPGSEPKPDSRVETSHV